MRWIFPILFGLALTAPLQAAFSPYYGRHKCGAFEVGGQALYWRPSSCDLSAAISDPRPFDVTTVDEILPQGPLRSVDPDYSWGTRVFLGYTAFGGCSDIRLSYIYLRASQANRFRPEGDGGLWPVDSFGTELSPLFNGTQDGRPDAISDARAAFDYDAVDLQFAVRQRIGRCWKGRVYAGLHYANIHQDFDVSTIGVFIPGSPPNFSFETAVRSHRQVWGVGPLLGLDLSYCLFQNVTLDARLSGGVMAGNIEGHQVLFQEAVQFISQTVTTRVGEIPFQSRHQLIPHLSASLGLSYHWMCGCLRFTGEIGYEFRTYINALERVTFNDERGTNQASCDSFRLDGLYFGLRLLI